MNRRCENSSPKLSACPNEGCIRIYKRFGSTVNHVAYGKCEFQREGESLLDTAKIMCSKKLWGGELSKKMHMGTTYSAATVVPLADSQKKERRKKKGYLFCQNYLFFSNCNNSTNNKNRCRPPLANQKLVQLKFRFWTMMRSARGNKLQAFESTKPNY